MFDWGRGRDFLEHGPESGIKPLFVVKGGFIRAGRFGGTPQWVSCPPQGVEFWGPKRVSFL